MKYFNIINLFNISFQVFGQLATLKSSENAIPNSYIVTLKQDIRNTIDFHIDQVKNLFKERIDSNKIESVFSNIGNVYHASFTPDILKKVRELREIEFIEEDGMVSLNTIQNNAPWGLARLSQRRFENKSTYNYGNNGTDIAVYILDTGVMVNHREFGGRAKWGANFIRGSPNSDEHGHGTHCAGTVGSKTYGVSKNVSLIAVKVLDATGNGSFSGIISGINWVAGDKQSKKGNIISMSIGGEKSISVNNAIDAATNKGILSIIAAGNSNDDACNYSPASANSAFTVAASDINDRKAYFSNYGRCVDIIAPGVDILSTWNNGKTNTISGTSMATPHVAGLAAYYMSKETLNISQTKALLQNSSTKNAIKGFNMATPNYLAYNNMV